MFPRNACHELVAGDGSLTYSGVGDAGVHGYAYTLICRRVAHADTICCPYSRIRYKKKACVCNRCRAFLFHLSCCLFWLFTHAFIVNINKLRQETSGLHPLRHSTCTQDDHGDRSFTIGISMVECTIGMSQSWTICKHQYTSRKILRVVVYLEIDNSLQDTNRAWG